MAPQLKALEAYGDSRSRDVLARDLHQVSLKPSDGTAATHQTAYGVDSSNSSFQLARWDAKQVTGASFKSALDLTLNSGSTASVDTLVASFSPDGLSLPNAHLGLNTNPDNAYRLS